MVSVRVPSRLDIPHPANHSASGQNVQNLPNQSAPVSGGAASAAVSGSALSQVLDDPALGVRRLQFNPGDQIVKPEAAATNVYLIHRGQVRLYHTKQCVMPEAATGDDCVRLIDVLGRDQWFGVAALAKANHYDCQAVAVTPTIISEIPADKLLPALMKRPEAMANVTRDLARSLMASRAETSRLMFDDCSQRLIATLLRLSTSAAAAPHEDGVVLHMTHSQLAQTVGAARETISLALTQLRRKNLIRTGRNQLFFNPEALKKSKTTTATE